MHLLIDNYDSFTFNLVHAFAAHGETVTVIRNDAVDVAGALALKPRAITISPGPCTPAEAGISVDLVRAAADAAIPLLGVCLGHQAIGAAFGGTVRRGQVPVHGKTSPVSHDGTGVFAGLPTPLTMTRYHSLTVDPADLPDCLAVTATSDDGQIMGLAHRRAPIHGVQFHPESIASTSGADLIGNFVRLARTPVLA